MIERVTLTVLLFFLTTKIGFGQEVILIDGQESRSISDQMEYYIDYEGLTNFENVASAPFRTLTAESMRVGALGKNIWLTLKIRNTSNRQANYFLYFIDPSIHRIILYDKGTLKKSGASIDQITKDVSGNRNTFRVQLEPNEFRTYYIQLFSFNKLTLNIELVRNDVYFKNVSVERITLGLFYGGILLVFLYSILLLVTTGFRMFAYFAGYVFFVGLLCGAGDGTTGEFFHWWVNWKGGFQDAAAAAVANILGVMFMILFLRVKSWSKIFYQTSVVFMLGVGIISFLLLAFNSLVIFDFLGLIGLLQIVFLNVAGFQAVRHKVPESKYYLISHLIFGVFIVLFILNLFRLVPYSFWTQYAIHLGYGASLLVLSLGQGVRMYSYYTQLIKEQREKQNLIKQRNETLKEEVITRTHYLEEKEGNLRAIIENNTSAIWLIDDQYTLMDFNSIFGNNWYTAYGQKLVIGQSLLDQIPTEELKVQWKPRYAAGIRGEVGTFNDKYKILDQWRNFEIKAFPIIKDDKVRGVSFFSTDITDQLNAKKRLEKQNNLLKKVNEELDSFVYSASHDLKAPLASVLGLIQLSRSEKEPINSKKYLDMMESSILRLDRFIKDIIDYSRNARTKTKVIPIDIRLLIESTIEDLRYIYEEDRVKINIDIQEECKFFGDETRVKVVVRNLLSNALKYGCGHDTKNIIDISVEISPSELNMMVRDYGPGIKPEYLHKVFDMFFRASETKSGTGLGLYIVKETVHKMNGKINLSSKYKQGCTFNLKLPNILDVVQETTPSKLS